MQLIILNELSINKHPPPHPYGTVSRYYILAPQIC